MRWAIVAISLAFIGGMKLGYLDPSIAIDPSSWATRSSWRVMLVVVGVLELTLAVTIALPQTRLAGLKWAVRLLAVFGVAQVGTELLSTDFYRACGCFGPAFSTGPTFRLLILGGLIFIATSAASSDSHRRSPSPSG